MRELVTKKIFLYFVCCVVLRVENVFGFGPSNAKIIGGQKADMEAFSFTLQVTNSKGSQFCSAVLITYSTALVAAHCLTHNLTGFDRTAAQVIVIGGKEERSKDLENSTYRKVKKIIRHPKYDKETTDNDIAILLLEEPFKSNDPLISVINIAETVPDEANCLICGWGRDEEDKSTDSLHYANVKLISKKKCQNYYTKYVISDAMVCAAWGDGGACKGDSGGPLVCNGQLVGLVSTGEDCRNRDNPGVFTKISHFSKWLNENVI